MPDKAPIFYETFPSRKDYNELLFRECITGTDSNVHGVYKRFGFFIQNLLQNVDKRESLVELVAGFVNHVNTDMKLLCGEIDGVVGYTPICMDIASGVTTSMFYNGNKEWSYVQPKDLSKIIPEPKKSIYRYPPKEQKNMALIIQSTYIDRFPPVVDILLGENNFAYVISCIDKRFDRSKNPINPKFPEVTYLYMTTLESVLKQEMPEKDFMNLKSKLIKSEDLNRQNYLDSKK